VTAGLPADVALPLPPAPAAAAAGRDPAGAALPAITAGGSASFADGYPTPPRGRPRGVPRGVAPPPPLAARASAEAAAAAAVAARRAIARRARASISARSSGLVSSCAVCHCHGC